MVGLSPFRRAARRRALGRHEAEARARRGARSPSPICCSSTSRRPASIRSRGASSGRCCTSCTTSGLTIVVSTPYMDEAEYASRIGFLDDGRLVDARHARRDPRRAIDRPLRRRAAAGPRRGASAVLRAVAGSRRRVAVRHVAARARRRGRSAGARRSRPRRARAAASTPAVDVAAHRAVARGRVRAAERDGGRAHEPGRASPPHRPPRQRRSSRCAT